jgi:hypothetical protein
MGENFFAVSGQTLPERPDIFSLSFDLDSGENKLHGLTSPVFPY